MSSMVQKLVNQSTAVKNYYQHRFDLDLFLHISFGDDGVRQSTLAFRFLKYPRFISLCVKKVAISKETLRTFLSK